MGSHDFEWGSAMKQAIVRTQGPKVGRDSESIITSGRKVIKASQYEQHDTPPIFFGRLLIFIFLMWFVFHLLYFDVIWLLLQNLLSLSSAVSRILDLGLFHLLDLLLLLYHEDNSKEIKYTKTNCHYNETISSKKRQTIPSAFLIEGNSRSCFDLHIICCSEYL